MQYSADVQNKGTGPYRPGSVCLRLKYGNKVSANNLASVSGGLFKGAVSRNSAMVITKCLLN